MLEATTDVRFGTTWAFQDHDDIKVGLLHFKALIAFILGHEEGVEHGDVL